MMKMKQLSTGLMLGLALLAYSNTGFTKRLASPNDAAPTSYGRSLPWKDGPRVMYFPSDRLRQMPEGRFMVRMIQAETCDGGCLTLSPWAYLEDATLPGYEIDAIEPVNAGRHGSLSLLVYWKKATAAQAAAAVPKK